MKRNLDELTLAELQQLARERGLRGVSRMRKPELLRELRRTEREPRGIGIPEPIEPDVLLRQWVQAQPWVRWLSRALRIIGGFGLTVSLLLMVVSPIATARAIPSVRSGLRSGADSLVSLAGSLDLAGEALRSAAGVLEGTGEALSGVERSIANTQPLIESVAGLVGSTVPVTIEGTQRTLEVAVQGAEAIDQVLRGLAALGPLTGIRYDPENTLGSSLAEAAAGLEPIPAALRDMESELEEVGSELDDMRDRLRGTASDLTDFAADLRRVDRELTDRAADLRQLAAGLNRAADSAELWMWGTLVAVELVLLGVAATQLGLVLIGRRLAAAA